MKLYITTSIFLFVLAFAKAQEPIILDTIYANDQKNVALFFPQPIRQAITGAGNFVFTYNREKEQYFGLLQARPGRESNLLVITANGSVFSYIVRYKERLAKLNYFIAESNSIGNEKPLVEGSEKEGKPKIPVQTKKEHYREFCSRLIKSHQKTGHIKKRRGRVILSVENIVFNKDALYFVIQVENRSSLDYGLDFLNLSVKTRKKGKKKSLQSLYQEPVLKYDMPSKVKEGTTARFVYVLPKFSISNDRRAVLELNEKNGERNLKLSISHRFINNPN